MTFHELGVTSTLISALAKLDITEPMPIQTEAIHQLLAKKDAYITSETGSGKTLAYLLPLLCCIDSQKDIKHEANTQVLVIAPTHELAIQIHRVCNQLTQYANLPISAILLLGGTAIDRQIDKLKKKPAIAIGSPGRILELINKGKLKIKNLKSIVVDEADRLLTGDSLETVRSIILAAPPERQIILVSATNTENTQEVASFSRHMITIKAAHSLVNSNIKHGYLICEERKKTDILRKLIHATKANRAIVFVHRNETAQIVASKLAHHGLLVVDLQGGDDKNNRKYAMENFRSGRAKVLVASDVAARGLDIPEVTHIFNFDLPTESKDYLHRVGRTARGNSSGTAISLLTEIELRLMLKHKTDLGIDVKELELKEGKVFEI